ncbi:TonB-dependent receptor [candidate division KSB1 bacterium]|nr:TonB-dependent receptor [candidate division KSB1 bacterium]
MKRIACVFAILFVVHCYAQKGEIRGTVLDQSTLQPLAGVNVIVQATDLGAATDTSGKFVIERMPVGIYSLVYSYIGYEKKIVPDVVVKSNRITYSNATLNWTAIEAQALTVTAGYYVKPEDAPVSVQSLSFEEIRRQPGAREDVSRMLQNLPGVNPTTDDHNDLVVRGGAPSEVLFTVDHVDIPNPNHFGTQGATGGPISMINAEFLEDVKFMAGGFTAPYGHKLSGVMDISFREGNRNSFDGKFDLNMAGAGGFAEGPIQNGRGSFLIGLHRSFLDIMESFLDYGGIPIYSNVQGKVVYDLNVNNYLSALLIGGDDRIDFEDEFDPKNFRPARPDTVDYSAVNFRTRQYTIGASLRTFWRKNLYSIFSLSHSNNRFYTYVNLKSIAGFRDQNDELDNKSEIQTVNIYNNTSVEQTSTFNGEFTWSLPNRDALSFGAYLKLFQFDHTIDYTPAHPGEANAFGQIPMPSYISVRQNVTPKTGGYVNYKKLWGSVITNLGLRYDYFDLLGSSSISPRLGFRWEASPLLAFNAGGGRYYQSPEFLYLTGDPANKNSLEDIGADHYIAGLEYMLTADTRLTLEIYRKNYFQYPVLADSGYEMLSMANSGAVYGNTGSNRLVSAGEGKVHGIEAMIQKKLAEKVYGLVSYSYSRIRHKALDGIFRHGGFDNRHVFNLVIGYRASKAWEFSFKWRYAGGTPYTPYSEAASYAAGRAVLDLTRINEARLEPYHRLDLRFDHRSFYNKVTLVSYFSLENAYNRRNQSEAYWNNASGKTDFRYQTGFFPIGGFSLEF